METEKLLDMLEARDQIIESLFAQIARMRNERSPAGREQIVGSYEAFGEKWEVVRKWRLVTFERRVESD